MSQNNPEKHTVQELINKLTELVKERPELGDQQIELEGCDCVGNWNGGIKIEPYEAVLLER